MTGAKAVSAKSTYPGRILTIGSRGGPVAKVQARLNDLRNDVRADDKKQPKLVVDKEFGEQTAKRVTQFQAHHGLQPDGEVGPQTWAKLFDEKLPPVPKKSLAERAFSAAVALIGVREVGGKIGRAHV